MGAAIYSYAQVCTKGLLPNVGVMLKHFSLLHVPTIGSAEVRSPRPDSVKFRVGQVIRHKQFGYRGVIIGWDAVAKVSKSFVTVVVDFNVYLWILMK